MDKNTRYLILAAVGAVGVYIIYKGGYLAQWFPSLFGPAVPAKTGPVASPAGSTAPPSGSTATPPAAKPPVVEPQPYKPIPYVPPTPPANPVVNGAAGCPAGQVNVNGTCLPANDFAPQDPMTKIATAAGRAGVGPLLNMDQWCYFAAQVGVNCPDPGSVDPALYEGAWGPGTDRTTPIAVDTFWYLATTTGLSGMASLSRFLT